MPEIGKVEHTCNILTPCYFNQLSDDQLLDIAECPHPSHDAFIMVTMGSAYIDRNYVG